MNTTTQSDEQCVVRLSGKFKGGPTLFSMTFEGLEFFPKFKDFEGLLQDPMNPG